MATLLLNEDQFVGFFTIDFSTIADDFTDYAEQLEKMILTDCFGLAMYNDMVANPTEQKYVDLITDYDLADMLRNFFYFYYLRDRESYSSTLGEFSSEAENSVRDVKSRNKKITDTYNAGFKLYNNAAEYVQENTDIYTLYTETEPIQQVNVWGIVSTYPNVDIPDNWFLRGFRCYGNIY